MSSTPRNCPPASIPAIPVAFGPERRRTAPQPIDVVQQSFASSPTAARWARRHTAVVLSAWGLSDLEPAVLQIVSELVANAAARPLGLATPYAVGLTLRLLPDRISIEVFDPDPSTPAFRAAAPDAERGRGLTIVRALAAGFGVLPVAHGKVVLAQVLRSDGGGRGRRAPTHSPADGRR